MIVAIIILGIFLLISILFNLASLKTLFNVMQEIKDLDDLREEYDFLNGDIDIAEDRIAQKFPNTILLCHIEKNSDSNDDSTTKIFDISNYAKNHVIGLTYFVQPQLFEDLKSSTNADAMRDRLRAQFLKDHSINPDEADEEFVNQLIDDAMKEVMNEGYFIDEANGAMTRPLIPNCTVYQLKDGRWLWRQES